jgi:pyridoxal 5'-phosphate synthase pdxS subunit
LILRIKETVSIPVMAKCRIGHFVEAQILEAIGVDYIDESEVLTPADEAHHIYKHKFTVPFVCGCRNLGEALRRIGEGAAMIRTKGEAGTGDVVEAVRHARSVLGEIRRLQTLPEEELMAFAKEIQAPYELVLEVRSLGRLPVVNFAAGGLATPADAALMMQLGSMACLSARAFLNQVIRLAGQLLLSRQLRTISMPTSWRKSAEPGRTDGRAADFIDPNR